MARDHYKLHSTTCSAVLADLTGGLFFGVFKTITVHKTPTSDGGTCTCPSVARQKYVEL